jgi:hypothetical protein
VPHLSESLSIGIERWQFVEGEINEFARLMNPSFVPDSKEPFASGADELPFMFRAEPTS